MMSDAELKLQLIRLIDEQQGQALRAIYEFLQRKFKQESSADLATVELGYQAMAADKEREAEALEWLF